LFSQFGFYDCPSSMKRGYEIDPDQRCHPRRKREQIRIRGDFDRSRAGMTPQHLGDVLRQRRNFDYAEGNRDDAGETDRERSFFSPCDFLVMPLLWRVVTLTIGRRADARVRTST
jgi:hypothetical protein